MNPWLLLGGLVTAALAFMRKDDVAAGAEAIVATGKDWLFNAIVPSEARAYAPLIWRVAAETGTDPFVLAAIGWRESRWGTTKHLDVPGPAGTGDFLVRGGRYRAIANVRLVNDAPNGWSVPANVARPYALPADGRGWGRGLMQIDFERASQIDWEDPETNIRAGALILTEKLDFLRGKGLTGDQLLRAAVAAYNTGQGNVWASVQAGRDVDATTHGGDYSADVMANAGRLRALFAQG